MRQAWHPIETGPLRRSELIREALSGTSAAMQGYGAIFVEVQVSRHGKFFLCLAGYLSSIITNWEDV
jgi:hypothetical protein